jgi:hypothetical protein
VAQSLLSIRFPFPQGYIVALTSNDQQTIVIHDEKRKLGRQLTGCNYVIIFEHVRYAKVFVLGSEKHQFFLLNICKYEAQIEMQVMRNKEKEAEEELKVRRVVWING